MQNRGKTKIEKAASELKNGTAFDTAGDLSEGDSKKDGGDLGWTNIDALVPELQEVARTQSIDSVSPILESTLRISYRRRRGSQNGVRDEYGSDTANIYAKPSFRVAC